MKGPTMFTTAFWNAALERAIRGGAIAASAMWPVSSFTTIDAGISAAGLAAFAFVWGAIASLLLSLAGSQVGTKGDPSFVTDKTIPGEVVRADEGTAEHTALTADAVEPGSD